jgi:hypothetical protein
MMSRQDLTIDESRCAVVSGWLFFALLFRAMRLLQKIVFQ